MEKGDEKSKVMKKWLMADEYSYCFTRERVRYRTYRSKKWTVKPKNCIPECTITFEIFSGEGHSPCPDPSPLGREKSLLWPNLFSACGTSIVAPLTLHTSRFRCSVLCVPYFQCRLLATLVAALWWSRLSKRKINFRWSNCIRVFVYSVLCLFTVVAFLFYESF